MSGGRPIHAIALLALAWVGQAHVHAQCISAVNIPRSAANQIEADATRQMRILEPTFFGFNLEWLEFQGGLWDSAAQQVRPGVATLLTDFAGAVYRFPGGTNSNHINWRDAVGPISGRPFRQHVAWLGPVRAEFGVDEYLRFVKAVKGQAWYVANLYGSLEGASAPEILAANAGELAAYLKLRASEGYPPVLRWELGNELDRAQYKWSTERLGNTALQVASAISQHDPSAKFVHLQQEYPAQAEKGLTASQYNHALRAKLTSLQPEFALHFYYDGPPDTPPISYFLRQLCQVVESAKAEGSDGKIWVTESGRVPNGFWPKTPKALWPATANLEAAISVADMLIALSQIPEAQGAFSHALVADNSPWPMFHRRTNGVIEPTATLLGLKVLRQFMLPVVLQTTQSSSGSGTLGAAYVVRSAVMSDTNREKFTVWAINRSSASQQLTFRLSNANKVVQYERSAGIWDEQANASNYASGMRLAIDSQGWVVEPSGENRWVITLPPNAVSAHEFATRH